MKRLNPELFDSLPFIGRKELVELRTLVEMELLQNNGIIFWADPEETQGLYKFVDASSKFSFTILFSRYEIKETKNLYMCKFSPRDQTSLSMCEHISDFKGLTNFIRTWAGFIKQISDVTEEYYNIHQDFYQGEFQYFFTNDEPDCNTTPYDIDRQEIIYKFLEHAESKITADDSLDDSLRSVLIADIATLKQTVVELPKKAYVALLSKFASKLKRFSNKAFHDVFDVVKKEGIKALLSRGVEEAQQILLSSGFLP